MRRHEPAQPRVRTPDDLSAALGRPLPAPQRDALVAYVARLADAATRINLTAVREIAGIERRHIAESLALVRVLEGRGLLPAGAEVIDVGSGGGLPGIPLAIARPDIAVTLLEATSKKAAFLREACAALGLRQVSVIAARAEEAGRDPARRERYDLAAARAVAALATLAELTLPLVHTGGWVAAVKGSRVHDEIAAGNAAVSRCGGQVREVTALGAPGDEPLSVVLIAKCAPTPPDLPRRSGMPAKRPLR